MTDIRDLSVVIPTLNAEATLTASLESLFAAVGGPVGEVIVVDCGSIDRTVEIAAAAGARVLSAPRGRGHQLRAGGTAAAMDWILFLHADTRLEPGWEETVRNYMEAEENREHAAAFRFRLDSEAPAARRVERLVTWRNRTFRLPYGDQALLLHRTLYQRVGGFRPMPLFEDVDIIRRLGRRRVRLLDAAALTSSSRFQRDGWWLRPLRNLSCLLLYLLGVPPSIIARVYK